MEHENKPWFFGKQSRQEAEDILDKNGGRNGLFLVRNGSRDQGFVLSMCVVEAGKKLKVHFQIRVEREASANFFTFDTETEKGPLFRTLSQVVDYLMKNSSVLPTPLTDWCTSDDYEDVDEVDDGMRTLEVAIAAALDESGVNRGTGTLKDAINQHPTALSNIPYLQVSREGSTRSLGKDTQTGAVAALHEGDILSVVGIQDFGGAPCVLLKDDRGRVLQFPLSSDVQVVPVTYSKLSNMEKPPVPTSDRPNMRIPESVKPPPAKRQLARKESLAELLEAAGGKLMLNDKLKSTEDHHFFFRDIIKEGWASKLPPARNRIQRWRKRWFKLVISLHRSFLTGPVNLEYYSNEKQAKPKGVIPLDKVEEIRKVAAVPKSSRQQKYYPGTKLDHLFEIVLPQRVYVILAPSAESADAWVTTLRDLLHEIPEKTEQFRPEKALRTFHGVVLNREIDNPEGIIEVGDNLIFLKDPQTGKPVAKWSFQKLRGYGYVKQVVWFEVTGTTYVDAGVFCFATQCAESLYEIIGHFVTVNTGASRTQRWSRRNNMSWSSIHDEEAEEKSPPECPPRSNTGTQVVFGKTIPADDLLPVAYGIAIYNRKASYPNEVALKEGEIVTLLATKAFYVDGFFLGIKQKSGDYGLVIREAVQVYEHEFGNMRDMDDDGGAGLSGSRDSLLDDVDQTMYEYQYETPSTGQQSLDSNFDPTAVYAQSSKKFVGLHTTPDANTDGDVYEVPVTKKIEGSQGFGESTTEFRKSLTHDYVEPDDALPVVAGTDSTQRASAASAPIAVPGKPDADANRYASPKAFPMNTMERERLNSRSTYAEVQSVSGSNPGPGISTATEYRERLESVYEPTPGRAPNSGNSDKITSLQAGSDSSEFRGRADSTYENVQNGPPLSPKQNPLSSPKDSYLNAEDGYMNSKSASNFKNGDSETGGYVNAKAAAMMIQTTGSSNPKSKGYVNAAVIEEHLNSPKGDGTYMFPKVPTKAEDEEEESGGYQNVVDPPRPPKPFHIDIEQPNGFLMGVDIIGADTLSTVREKVEELQFNDQKKYVFKRSLDDNEPLDENIPLAVLGHTSGRIFQVLT